MASFLAEPPNRETIKKTGTGLGVFVFGYGAEQEWYFIPPLRTRTA